MIVASDVLTGEMAERARRMTQAYEAYTQLRVLKQPLAGVYLSFFVMVTLLILVGSTWMGLYLAKRITRPVQMLSAAAREIGAGRLEQRIEHQADDEFGDMVESFNAMAADLSARQRSLERATIELEQRHHEVERRHRSVETILERIATGVVSIDSHGAIGRVNSAAARLLGLGPGVEGRPVAEVLGAFPAVTALIDDAARGRGESVAQELALTRDGREMTLAVAATRLYGAGGFEGTVVVLDDVTPLIRAQKVAAWREVARRLAHEIKNPLTPIQLSAERLQRKLGDAERAARRAGPRVHRRRSSARSSRSRAWSTSSRSSRACRRRGRCRPRSTPCWSRPWRSTTACSATSSVVRQFDDTLPAVRLDADQFKRVVINLVDNAIEAMEHRGQIVVETSRDPVHALVRVVVADDGPGIPPGERDKLFLPYYSTKRRGSGPRPGHRPPDRRRARRQRRSDGQCAAGHAVHHRAALLIAAAWLRFSSSTTSPACAPHSAGCCATRAMTSTRCRRARPASSGW